jgi:hypothetical protein
MAIAGYFTVPSITNYIVQAGSTGVHQVIARGLGKISHSFGTKNT